MSRHLLWLCLISRNIKLLLSTSLSPSFHRVTQHINKREEIPKLFIFLVYLQFELFATSWMSCLLPFFHGLKGLTETERDGKKEGCQERREEGEEKKTEVRETDHTEDKWKKDMLEIKVETTQRVKLGRWK